MTDTQHVHILLASHNGGKFLRQQLLSLLDQTHQNWSLWVSDDGSTDNTRSVVEQFCDENPDRQITLLNGPCRGHAQNFLSLLKHSDIPLGYVATSDQDDVWLPHKLTRGLEKLAAAPQGGPLLYGGRTSIVEEDLSGSLMSPLFKRPPSFRNALVQNVMGGNTHILNPAAVELVRKTPDGLGIWYVDWWLYQLVSGCGGGIIFDFEPGVLYRQHDNNVIGSFTGTKACAGRIWMLLSGYFRNWNDENIRALTEIEAMLTPENRKILAGFRQGRQNWGLRAWAMFRQVGLYRQTKLGDLSLFLAAIMHKM
jgi:glycosyltransferase involved in cell wall biosynthesis